MCPYLQCVIIFPSIIQLGGMHGKSQKTFKINTNILYFSQYTYFTIWKESFSFSIFKCAAKRMNVYLVFKSSLMVFTFLFLSTDIALKFH